MHSASPFMQAVGRGLAPIRRTNSRATQEKALSPADSRGGWQNIVREFYPGAWQQGVETNLDDTLRHWVVFRCVQIIAADVAKMGVNLVRRGADGVWHATEDRQRDRLLRRPNQFQNRIQFFENWMTSKLVHGNAYILKKRDRDERVISLHVLDPLRTIPLITDEGEVFYEIQRDNIVGLTATRLVVPADEIIHDRWNCLYHPLVGLSPIYAAAVTAMTGTRIENNSAHLFANGARPGGVLTAPGAIAQDTADRMKAYWDENFTGKNAGKVAVLGDGLTYAQMALSAVDAQLVEQLGWGSTAIAGVFGVPAYMINAAAVPATNNVEALTQQYYSQCLQQHVEQIEAALDDGLGLLDEGNGKLGVMFDLDDLLRMDTATLVKTAGEGVARGILTPNEARAKLGHGPIEGGSSAYLQQQNFSLQALAKRDAKDDPFANAPAPTNDNTAKSERELQRRLDDIFPDSSTVH